MADSLLSTFKKH